VVTELVNQSGGVFRPVDQQSGVLGRGVLLHCVTRQAQPPHDKGRALPPGTQALMALVYLRKGETFAEPAARSPRLGTALRRARADGLPYLILDGTLIEIERVAADRPFYSGKHRKARGEPAGVGRPGQHPAVGIRRTARSGARSDGPGERANAQLEAAG
jgi:hypothetical protein